MSANGGYHDDLARLRERDSVLAVEFASFTGIRGVLDWMRKSGLAKARIDIVGQDEFHYDFMIELEPAGRWAAFGVT